MAQVTDPALLAQLNAPPVTDPAILAQLNGGASDDDVPPDSQMTAAQVHAKSTGSYAELEPKEPGLAHLLWSVGKPFMDIGETARGQAPLPAPGPASLSMAATPAFMGHLDVGEPASAPQVGAADTFLNNRAANKLPPVTDPATRNSFLRVSKLADDTKASPALAGTNPSDLQVMGGVRSELNGDLDGIQADLAASKVLSASQQAALQNAADAAAAHTRTLTPGMLASIDDMALPDDVSAYVKNKLMDANIASTQQYGVNSSGPGRTIGQAIGGVTHLPFAKQIGGAVGGAVDRAMGNQQPAAALQAMRIAQQMRAVGIDPDAAGAPLVRPGMPQPPVAAPTPGRVPAFIRPAVSTPAPVTPYGGGSTPAPPVFQAPIAAVPRPNPAPPFVRPPVAAPTSVTPYGGGSTPAPPVFQAPAPVAPNPAPPFVRPNIPGPVAPNPAPPFVRPNIPGPVAPNPAPPFVRPNIPGPAAPNPAPPFIRPAVSAPPVSAALSPYGGGSTPPNVALMAAQRAAGQRALAEQQAQVGGIGQPDPATGLPPSAIPPNVPIRANVPTPAPQPAPPTLPPLRVDTPQTVGAVMAQDGGALPPQTPGSTYVANGASGVTTHQQAVDAAQRAETAGVVPAGTAAKVAFSPAPLDPAVGKKVVAFHNASGQADVGLPTDSGPYSPDIRKAVAMKTYVDNTQRLMATVTDPTVHAALANIVSEPTLAGKATLAQQLGANPVVKATLDANQWLLKTGGK